MKSRSINGKKSILISITCCLLLFFGILLGYLTNHVFSENAKFKTFAQEIFQQEVSQNALSLHYSLSNPEKYQITPPAPTLGTVSINIEETQQRYKNYLKKLKEFSYSKLSSENQLTLDMLLLHYHTLIDSKDYLLLEEILSPSLGIQAQLPVLLAEYTFSKDKDISNYLNLLISIKPYFQSILDFEQQKAAAGYFMSDTTLNRVLEQCHAFIQNPESNYMLDIFEQKIEEYGKFSEEDQEILKKQHKKILLSHVIPAYQQLITGLEQLRGSGTNNGGLAGFENGKEYYQFLIKTQVGTYDSIPQIEQRLSQQLVHDCKQLTALFQKHPSLSKTLTESSLTVNTPESILAYLQKRIRSDFPALDDCSYELRYVHPSMEEYLSPAFYLTPPLDTGSPNTIYINRSSQTSHLDLFSTLAHEGFPGHLYQTVFFGRQNPLPIRYLITSGGYVEGWATYIESYAHEYAAECLPDKNNTALTQAAFLNKNIHLCIYSLLDIGIHYHGWSEKQAANFLNRLGIRDSAAIEEIFQYIVETPGNYLKYYYGYINFLDLKNEYQQKSGKNFDLTKFHEDILDIGPVPFPVLKKYLFQKQEHNKTGGAVSTALLHFTYPLCNF